jgi:hypothetical protein
MSMRGRPFQPGNTFGRGRPKGSRNKTSKRMQEWLYKYGDSLIGKCIAMALREDKGAMKLCIERLLPARHDGYVHLRTLRATTIPEIGTSFESLLKAIAEGRITPMEGETIGRILDTRRHAIDTEELEARVKQLEQYAAKNNETGGYE